MKIRRALSLAFAALVFAAALPAEAAPKKSIRFQEVLTALKGKGKTIARGSGQVKTYQQILHDRWAAVIAAYAKLDKKRKAALEQLDVALERADRALGSTKGPVRRAVLKKIRFITRSGERIAGLRTKGAPTRR